MNSFFILFKKEIKEHLRNYKLLILWLVLLLMGVGSPILAKITPELFAQMDLSFEITVPAATYMDAYAQFFKNMTQLCCIVVILIFSSNITHETEHGTAILLFAKGLSRGIFIWVKYISTFVIWTSGYFVSSLCCYGVTSFLFPDQMPRNLFLSMVCLWLFISFILAFLILAGSVFRQSFLPMIATAIVLFGFTFLNQFPRISKYTPGYLSYININIINGSAGFFDVLPALLITTALLIFCVQFGVFFYKKRLL